MANVQRPGFLPAKTVGTNWVRERKIVESNNTTRIRKGDCVKFTGAGWVCGTSGTAAVSGASLGAVYRNADGEDVESPVLPAAELYSGTTVVPDGASYIYLPDDVNVWYIASCDEAITNANLQLNHAYVLGTTSSTYSDHEVDATSPNTTSTLPWRLRAFVLGPDNDPDLADAACHWSPDGTDSPAMNLTGLA